jgi:hypothetical protein
VTTETAFFNAKQGISSFKLSCPKGFVALGGGPVTLPAGVELGRSVPGETRRTWLFAFSSQAPARVKGEVRCGNVSFNGRRKVHFELQTNAATEATVAPGSTLRLKLKCTGGLVPTGIGQDQTPIPDGGPRQPGGISIQAALPAGRGFVLRLHNSGTSTAEGDYYLRCLKRTVDGEDMKVSTRTYSDQLGGSGRVKHACKHGQAALTTGWKLPSNTTLHTSFLSSTRWGHWVFQYGQTKKPQVKTALLCLQ